MKRILQRLLLPFVLLGLWQLFSMLGVWSAYLLPSPGRVWSSAVKMAQSGELLRNIAASGGRVLLGFAIAFVLAFLFGVADALFPRLTGYYGHLLELFRQVPPLALIPLLILWFGIGEASKLIVIVLASFFPILLNIKKGLACGDGKLLEVGDVFGLTKAQRFWRIALPGAVPDILVGMRVGLGYSWRAIIGAEMIAASNGLGYLILDAQQLSRSDRVIVGILVIGAVGILCDALFGLVLRKMQRGGTNYAWN